MCNHKKKHYGYSGSNGLGYTMNYDQYLKVREYLSGPLHIQKFDTMQEACHFAIDTYNEKQEDMNALYEDSLYLDRGYTYYRKQIQKRNRKRWEDSYE